MVETVLPMAQWHCLPQDEGTLPSYSCKEPFWKTGHNSWAPNIWTPNTFKPRFEELTIVRTWTSWIENWCFQNSMKSSLCMNLPAIWNGMPCPAPNLHMGTLPMSKVSKVTIPSNICVCFTHPKTAAFIYLCYIPIHVLFPKYLLSASYKPYIILGGRIQQWTTQIGDSGLHEVMCTVHFVAVLL